MNDSELLSAFQELSRQPAREQRRVQRALLFDACQLGVVVRAVLLAEAIMAVAAMFGATGFTMWLGRLAILSGAALPGTLGWLLVACSLKRYLARLPHAGQHACGIALGALAGVYGCGMLALVARPDEVPWIASAFAGALLSALLVAALALRAQGRTPAETTARLAELQARIRPHFLFNSLNSAIALVREDPARAESLLE
ncbi:MAG TPA: histidine kinase, partial [Ramlibacter sp.]